MNEVRYEMPVPISSNKLDILFLTDLFIKIENLDINKIILDYKNTCFFACELFGFYHFMINKIKKMVKLLLGLMFQIKLM